MPVAMGKREYQTQDKGDFLLVLIAAVEAIDEPEQSFMLLGVEVSTLAALRCLSFRVLKLFLSDYRPSPMGDDLNVDSPWQLNSFATVPGGNDMVDRQANGQSTYEDAAQQ